MRAILIGGTGLIGGLLLQKLLTDPVFSHVKLVSRRTAGIQHAKLEEVIIDFDNEAAYKREISNADVLFCAIGTTQKQVNGDNAAYRKVDFDVPVRAARFSATAYISKFILVSAVGANAASGNFYLKLKGETESAVLNQSIPFIYIMRPSLLLGNRKEKRLVEIISQPVMRLFSIFLLGGMAKYKAIHARDVANAMLQASKKTSAGKFICQYDEMKALIGNA